MVSNIERPTPNTTEPDIGAWIGIFDVQRRNIEQGIRDRLSLDVRAARLADADAELPEVENRDADDIQRIADQLEAKLQEVRSIALGRSEPVREVRLPPEFNPGATLEELGDERCQDERLWLFKGGIQEILYQYRDEGQALILEERDRLLGALSKSVTRMESVIGELHRYPVVAQAFDANDFWRIEQTLGAARELAARFKEVLTTPDAGVSLLLENNYYRLQGQFTAACAYLCLQLYGNVSNDHLLDLLKLKSVDWLNVTPAETSPLTLPENERKHLERKRDSMLRRVILRAEKESWPTWPILQIYNYNRRFGRRRPAERSKRNEEGLPSAEMPTNRAGIPLTGGW